MPPILLGILWAAVFAVPVSLLSRVRPPIKSRLKPRTRPASRLRPRLGTHTGRGPAEPASGLSWKGTACLLAINLVLLYGIDSLAFYFGRPMMTFVGLVPLILVNLVILAITATLAIFRRLNAGSVVATLAIVTFGRVAEHASPGVMFSGDLLFAGSIGRTDLPGGDYQTILASLARVCLPLPDETIVLSGHGPATTIGAERHSNPFLAGLTPAHGPARGL